MKTCLIYGQNGLDLDVTFNLRSFYKILGFWVVFSEKLVSADILVILRGVDKPLEMAKCNFGIVHVYDYGGWSYDALVKSLNYKTTTIFSTFPETRQRIISELEFPEKNIHIAFPPIDIQLWSKSLKPIKYEKVHIGNYKPIDGNDIINIRFNKAIIDYNVNVWGLGWNGFIDMSFYHSKLGLFEVSNIYSQSRFAFGLMYPFQRNNTFSGRFWHATLNGCYLLSEPGLYTSDIPGIIETDYSNEDIVNKCVFDYDRNKLICDAKEYWSKQFQLTLSFVMPTIRQIEYKKWSFIYKLQFIYMSILNILRLVYQKNELFKYFKK